MLQLTHADPEADKFDVLVYDYLVPKSLFIAADVTSGRMWCWQVDGQGNQLKTVEVKTGTVTIRERTDEEPTEETEAPAEQPTPEGG